jgi:hypothetical protein
MSRRARLVLVFVVIVLAALQVFQPRPSNPPVAPGASFEEAASPPPDVARSVQRSCEDCHSNRTIWPWYAHVSPVSWLVMSDVNEGREKLNLSEWASLTRSRAREKLLDMCRQLRKGEMPPWQYLLVHRDARMSPADVSAVCGFAERTARTDTPLGP